MHPDNRPQMLKFPFAVDFDVFVVVSSGDPAGAVIRTRSVRAEEIQESRSAVARHLDIGFIALCCAKLTALCRPSNIARDRAMAGCRAEFAAFPDAVFREESDDLVGVVAGVADIAVAGFEPFDRFDVVEHRNGFIQDRQCSYEFGSLGSRLSSTGELTSVWTCKMVTRIFKLAKRESSLSRGDCVGQPLNSLE